MIYNNILGIICSFIYRIIMKKQSQIKINLQYLKFYNLLKLIIVH
jgi:hypothetical protein